MSGREAINGADWRLLSTTDLSAESIDMLIAAYAALREEATNEVFVTMFLLIKPGIRAPAEVPGS